VRLPRGVLASRLAPMAILNGARPPLHYPSPINPRAVFLAWLSALDLVSASSGLPPPSPHVFRVIGNIEPFGQQHYFLQSYIPFEICGVHPACGT
jgi:hypothetical protein